jgi:tRNA threonylcarbamoyl adenosine modification protein (Sua5/YciO/YrdC/YwlC family)
VVVLPAFGDPPPTASIEEAASALRAGDIVGVPTDTVYGLAADPFGAVTDRLFLVKGRPRSVELPVLVSEEAQALELATAVPPSARRLMARYWPGALTLVLPRREGLNADLGEDDATIGIRCPRHPVPLALCAVVGPIATTSANRHNEPAATTAEQVAALAGVALVLDSGVCDSPASTVVDCTGETPKLLRLGAIGWDELVEVAGGR